MCRVSKNIVRILLSLSLASKFVLGSVGVKQELPADLFLIDKINAVIYGDEVTSVVTKSDTERLSLDGAPRTQDAVILEHLIFSDAQKFKITPDEASVDRYIAMVQRENNLSVSDLEKMFAAAGYTFKEGRQQLGIMFAVNSMIDFKIKSRLIVPEAQVIAYYDANPVREEASYKLQRAFIPVPAGVKREAFEKDLAKRIKTGAALPAAQWSSPFWIKESEIAADKQFIISLPCGALSQAHAVDDGYEVFRLLEKKDEHLVPLEDRYREISDQLRRPLFEKLFDDYKKGLFDSASIVYF